MSVARKPASHRLRLGRYSEPGRIYLLTTNTHGRHPLFADLHLGRLVVREMREVQERGMAETLAWVLMPDHLHWLVQLQDLGLSELMRRMKSRSWYAIKRATELEGQVWQSGYHDRALRRDEDLLSVARYVVANPLRAGLVNRLDDYPHWDAVWV
ncbi:transposase [Pseudomonas sp. WS 5013]|uniref:REP-associated tyrosine transposase n=1 Tax=Pseudomonas sp. WS 5013 TaxID=2717475 RepID=UPI001474BCFF|nr:transposase [Pseudomonas sp. WS 5013]NMY42849.1 transposase [Pseudomonas sp. WS 5013]